MPRSHVGRLYPFHFWKGLWDNIGYHGTKLPRDWLFTFGNHTAGTLGSLCVGKTMELNDGGYDAFGGWVEWLGLLHVTGGHFMTATYRWTIVNGVGIDWDFTGNWNDGTSFTGHGLRSVGSATANPYTALFNMDYTPTTGQWVSSNPAKWSGFPMNVTIAAKPW